MFDVNKLASIKVGLASPEKIREWSHGEVTKQETINYRSLKPEMDGLFCERIFGPAKDYECHCGKYKKIRYAGVVCEKCGVEVISKEVRRERMGHIELAAPCSHIWYLKGVPSRIGLVLAMSEKRLEEIIYFSAHVCLNPGTSNVLKYKQFLDDREGREKFSAAILEIKSLLDEGTHDYERASQLLARLDNLNEPFNFFEYARFISEQTGAEFGEGAKAVKRLLKEVDLDKECEDVSTELRESKGQKKIALTKRLECLTAFKNSGNRPEWMILDALPFIPPDLRPMLQLDGGRFAVSDLNDLYRRVISRNNRLKKLTEMNAPYVMIMNESRMLQDAVDNLIDNGRRTGKKVTGPSNRPLKSLSGALKSKQGRFRQNLLGKRVDYSGRSVIAVGPSLKMYQCGLPREMAINLLRPFIAAELIESKKCLLHKQADRKIDARDDDVLEIIEKIISDHPVLLNRAPTLHRLGIQAFQPVLVEGRAIRLHPLVCTGFNADFDGDQMAVHVPLGKDAQYEALNLMLASNNILSPSTGKPICTPSQDMLIGNYYLTSEYNQADFETRAQYFEDHGDSEEAAKYREYAKLEGKVYRNIDEAYKAYLTKQIHLNTRIALPGRVMKKTCFTEDMMNSYLITSVGAMIFNLIFPEDFPYVMNIQDTIANEKLSLADVDPVVYQETFFVPKGTNIVEYIQKQALRRPIGKKDIQTVIKWVFDKYGTGKTSAILDKIKSNGFEFSTVSGLTISIDDIKTIDTKKKIIEDNDKRIALGKERAAIFLQDEAEVSSEGAIKLWEAAQKQISKDVNLSLKKDKFNPLFIMKNSGARGSDSNFAQLMGMRGLMGSTSGKTIEIPIKSCFREGINVAEFFIGTHGARKGGADTALKTADSGYLTRRLVDVSQDVIVREEDCHSDHGTIVREITNTTYTMVNGIRKPETKVIVPLKDRLIGRFTCHDVINPTTHELIIAHNQLITVEVAEEIVAAGIKEVEIRSLFGCQTKDGVCVHCYGINLATGKLVEKGEAVGIMAAQSIGEPGTQLTMRTFHSGGVAGGDITQGVPRVAELFEARNPKGEALIAEIGGEITAITPEETKDGFKLYDITIENAENGDAVTLKTNVNPFLIVDVHDKVVAGQKLTEGSIAPKKLLEFADSVAVQDYITAEVQKVYRAQSIALNDKHIEVIIRQMLKKVFVVEPGTTNLILGTRVDKNDFTEANVQVLSSGDASSRPAVAKPIILGITKAALETESFLSAASFQETTRVLTDAAIKGKTDTLHGLKERVITGRLIPAGTGLLSYEEMQDKLHDFSVAKTMRAVDAQYKGVHDPSLQEVEDEEEQAAAQEFEQEFNDNNVENI